MNTSESIKTIMPLLLKAQKEIGAVKKDAVNPFYKSNYADLNSVIEACKDILNEKGIFVMQPVGHDEQGDYVETFLMHESGEFVSSQMRLVSTTDAQKQGSAITYARRYALQSLLFMQSVDDDGNEASKPVVVPQETILLENCVDCVKQGVKNPSIAAFVYEESMRDYGLSLCFTHRKDHKKLGA